MSTMKRGKKKDPRLAKAGKDAIRRMHNRKKKK